MQGITRAVISTILGAWLAVTLSFFALRILPGDAISAQLTEAGFGAAVIAERRAHAGLNDSLPVQYARYLADVLRGDLGFSLYTGENVTDIIMARAGSTFLLAGAAFLVMLGVAAILGLLTTRTGVVGRLGQAATAISLALPSYVTGTAVIFAVGLANPESVQGVFLAALVLGFHTAGAVAQTLGEAIRNVREQTYILAARGRGMPDARIFLRHLLPNAILPLLPFIAAQAGFLFGGTIVTEIVFARPGLGRLMLDSVLRRDIPVVQGMVLLVALVYAFCFLTARGLSAWIDPRPSL